MNDDLAARWSYGVNGVSVVYGMFSFQQWLAIAGLLLGVATFFLNAHYARRRDRRDEELRAMERRIRQAELDRLER